RKVADIHDEFSTGRVFVNHAGTKLGYLSNDNGKRALSIYEITSGTLLHSWDATKLFSNHCPDCVEQGVGWLSEGKLFLTEELGDEESVSENSHDEPGTYLFTEKGVELEQIASRFGRFLGSTPSGQ